MIEFFLLYYLLYRQDSSEPVPEPAVAKIARPIPVNARMMESSMHVAVKIRLSEENQELIAALEFQNREDYPIGIPHRYLFQKGVTNRFFEIANEAGDHAIYVGKLAKRRPPTLEDCVILKPQEKVTGKINLSRHYSLPPFKEFLLVWHSGDRTNRKPKALWKAGNGKIKVDASRYRALRKRFKTSYDRRYKKKTAK